jgi:tRNA (mo5U34)-methyltransferase
VPVATFVSDKYPWIANRLRRFKRLLLRDRFPHLPRSSCKDLEEWRRAVGRVGWFHTMDLRHGLSTVGCDPTPQKLQVLGIPQNLSGQSVLDIGAWDGFFSFEAERRGASYVLATDKFSWGHGGWGTMDGFELARRFLKSRVCYKAIDVMELSTRAVGKFDLVLFLGVLYHMQHPLLALERVADVTRGLLVLETAVDLLDCPQAAMAFYPGNELNNDPTNWWGPNPKLVTAMLRTVGFRTVKIHSGPWFPYSQIPRMVFHACK